MATYVLTPENTEIKISYRGLFPLFIVKSALFDGKNLASNDTFNTSAFNWSGMKIKVPVLGYGWKRFYHGDGTSPATYHGILKSMGDTSKLDLTKEGVFYVVSPKINIDEYYAENAQTLKSCQGSIQVDNQTASYGSYNIAMPYLISEYEERIYYSAILISVFVDSNGIYKAGDYPPAGIAQITDKKAKEPYDIKRVEIDIAPNFSPKLTGNLHLHNEIVEALYNSEETDPNNPYSGGGTSGPGGGGGSFSGDTDPIDIPDLPSISAVDAGFITIYKPTLDELRNLSRYMWSDLFSLDSFKKLFADPMDCILGLNIMPFGIAAGGKANVYVGNMDTGINMTLAQQQYVAVDCGSVRAAEYSGSFFDYSPHTKYNIYLPYIGIEPLDPDEITGKDIRVVYHIDILTGSLICYVKVGNAVMYEYQGSCGQTIPINGNDFTNVFMGAVQIAGNVAGMVSTGGASAGAIAGGLLSSTSTAAGMKPNIEKSGSLSGAGGFLGNQKPFIIKETPRQCMPLSQQKYTGFPSYQTQRLGSLKGYTEVESVNLSGIPANDLELNEIESLLKGGVYL